PLALTPSSPCLTACPPPISLVLLLYFFFYRSGAHRDLHSFPTRRSSDLHCRARASRAGSWRSGPTAASSTSPSPPRLWSMRRARSEEHTSELQSRFDLVCRLLLEKKKRTSQKQQH